VALYCVGLGANCGVQDYVVFGVANCVELDCISGCWEIFWNWTV
jgi:hypothetical protein